MSDLLTKLKQDQLAARKAKNAPEVTFLSTLIGGAAALAMKDSIRRDPTDADVIKASKQMEAGLLETQNAMQGQGQTGERLDQLQFELGIVRRYIPQQMDEAQVRTAIAAIRADRADAKLPDIMKAMKTSYAGQYDGTLVSTVAKEVLAASSA